MPLDPNEIEPANLPRRLLGGGFKVAPTVELLKRVAWDYRELLHEVRALSDEVAGARQSEVDARKAVDEIKAELETLHTEVALYRERDVAARDLLSTAQHAARERRDSARREAESVLKAARLRARQIEADAERANIVAARRELERLQTLQRQLRHQLISSLEELLAFVERDAAPAGSVSGEPPLLGSHVFNRIEQAAAGPAA